MPKIKIYLNPGETELDAHLSLTKALDFHNSGEAHDQASFEDPALVDASHKLFDIYSDLSKKMISEILKEL